MRKSAREDARIRAAALRAAAKVTLLFAVVDCVDGSSRQLATGPDDPMADAGSIADGGAMSDGDAEGDALADANDEDEPAMTDADAALADAAPPGCGFCDPPDASFSMLGCGASPFPLTGAGASLLEGAPVACCLQAITAHVVVDPAGATDYLDAAGTADPSIYACCTLIVAWVGTGGLGITPDVDAACCNELGSPTVQGCSPWGPPMPPAA